jgi:hypothetical protein
MNPFNLSSRIRLALLRTAMRATGYLLRKAIAPVLASALKPAPADARTNDASSRPESGRVINGEYRRVDTHHNNSW